MQQMMLVSIWTGKWLCPAGTCSELALAPIPNTQLGSLLPWLQQLWGHHLPQHSALKSLARRMCGFILCNKKNHHLGNLVLPFQVTDINWVQPLFDVWWSGEEETESALHVAFTSQNHSWPLVGASGHRSKISGVWEDPILFHFLLFQNKEEKLFPVGTTRGTLAILVSNEPPKGREHKSIFAHLPSSLLPSPANQKIGFKPGRWKPN